MHDTPVVAVSDAGGNPARHEARLWLGHRSDGVDVVEKVSVVGYLHHKVHLERRLHEAIDAENVRVPDPFKGAYFSRQKLVEKLSRRSELLDDLYGDLKWKTGVSIKGGGAKICMCSLPFSSGKDSTRPSPWRRSPSPVSFPESTEGAPET